MAEWFQLQAASGSLLLAIPVAMTAGLVSFFTPCVLPLIPGYLSYATGLSGSELASGEAGSARMRGRMVAGSSLFVLGFAAVFVALGALSGAIGFWLVEYRRTLTVVLGILTIVLGLVFAGVVGKLSGVFNREWRVHSVPAVGLGAAPVLGFLFGLGWTPCIGPTLSVITGLSLTEATAGRGALLSVFYALGLGIPFILAGLFYHRALGAFAVVRRHQAWVMRAGGGMLVVVGLMLVTGVWDETVAWLQVNLISDTEVAVRGPLARPPHGELI